MEQTDSSAESDFKTGKGQLRGEEMVQEVLLLCSGSPFKENVYGKTVLSSLT